MLRLTGGVFRGRMIETPKSHKTRPTSSMLRQALFNSLQTLISEAKVVDLFAGSGALGFEALSRGAAHVHFIENNKAALASLKKNVQSLDVRGSVQVIDARVEDSVKELILSGPFDLVLADPPYAGGFELPLIHEWPWNQLLTPGGRFCLEWGPLKSGTHSLPDQTEFLVKVREKNYGDSRLTTYERVSE